jgi:DeoR/GlpR family transcriptional regulator of sugar metabolism
VGLSSIARLDEIDVMITDDGLPQDVQRLLQSRIGELMIAAQNEVKAELP